MPLGFNSPMSQWRALNGNANVGRWAAVRGDISSTQPNPVPAASSSIPLAASPSPLPPSTAPVALPSSQWRAETTYHDGAPLGTVPKLQSKELGKESAAAFQSSNPSTFFGSDDDNTVSKASNSFISSLSPDQQLSSGTAPLPSLSKRPYEQYKIDTQLQHTSSTRSESEDDVRFKRVRSTFEYEVVQVVSQGEDDAGVLAERILKQEEPSGPTNLAPRPPLTPIKTTFAPSTPRSIPRSTTSTQSFTPSTSKRLERSRLTPVLLPSGHKLLTPFIPRGSESPSIASPSPSTTSPSTATPAILSTLARYPSRRKSSPSAMSGSIMASEGEDEGETAVGYLAQSKRVGQRLVEPPPPRAVPSIEDNYIPRCPRHVDMVFCDDNCFQVYDGFDETPDIEEALRTSVRIQPKRRNLDQEAESHGIVTALDNLQLVPNVRLHYLSIKARKWIQMSTDRSDCPVDGGAIHTSFSDQEATITWLTIWSCIPELNSQQFTVFRTLQFLTNYTQMSDVSHEDTRLMIDYFASEIDPYVRQRTTADIIFYINDSIETYNTPGSMRHDAAVPYTLLLTPKHSTLDTDDENPQATSDDDDEPMILPDHDVGRKVVGEADEDQNREFSRVTKKGYAVSQEVPRPRHKTWTETRLQRELGLDFSSEDSVIRMQMHALQMLNLHKRFCEGSNDIVGLAWSPNGRFALGTLTNENEYNKPRNLLLGYGEDIKELDGHFTEHRTVGRRYNAVNSVDFSGNHLLSASRDSTVKVWTEEGELINSLKFTDRLIEMRANENFHGLFAATTEDCMVTAARVDEHGQLCGHQEFNPINKRVSPSALAWAENEWLFVGYEPKETVDDNGKTGDLKIFNTNTGVESQIRPGAARHFDLCLDSTNQLLITGVISQEKTANSHVRIYDWKRSRAQSAIEFDSPQIDLNTVTISRCGNFLTCSGTDSRTIMWDRRDPNKPLHILEHGKPLMPAVANQTQDQWDTGVHFAQWYMESDMFLTGGSDGVVKVWDPRRADPFCYDLANLDGPITRGAFSPLGDMLMLGQCTGHATLLSFDGTGELSDFEFKPATHVTLEQAANFEESPSGAVCAAELIANNTVVKRDGCYWAADIPYIDTVRF